MSSRYDPQERLAAARKEFGEWGGVNASIEVSTTFTVLDASTMPAMFAGEKGPDKGSCYVYGRSYNPTVRYLGRQLAALEDTESAYACSSGIAAISSTLLALCNSGDHIVASNAVYGGTFALMKTFLPAKTGIHTTFVNITDLDAVEAAMTPNTKVLYTECVSNPTLVVADLPRLAALAHSRGVKLVVDNTFTPLVITPSRLGADVVVHSLTKFISGASDIIAGAVCGKAELINQLMDLNMGPMMLLGPTMDPKIASELSLRIPHLPTRMEAHCNRAALYAARLQALGAKVVYPGLPDHPQHELLRSLRNPGYGFGGILGLDMGSQHRAEQLMERLQNVHSFGLMAVSLGYFETLLSCSGASTSSELSAADKAKAGISDGYVRISAGITGTAEQRWSQLEEAYLCVTGVINTAGEPVRNEVVKKVGFQVRSSTPSEQSSDETDYSINAASPPPSKEPTTPAKPSSPTQAHPNPSYAQNPSPAACNAATPINDLQIMPSEFLNNFQDQPGQLLGSVQGHSANPDQSSQHEQSNSHVGMSGCMSRDVSDGTREGAARIGFGSPFEKLPGSFPALEAVRMPVVRRAATSHNTPLGASRLGAVAAPDTSSAGATGAGTVDTNAFLIGTGGFGIRTVGTEGKREGCIEEGEGSDCSPVAKRLRVEGGRAGL